MRDELTQQTALSGPLSILSEYLNSENDVLRTAALRAFVCLEPDAAAKRRALKEALLDPDPDIRSDAMEALAKLATPADAAVIRRSLEGDPVREVKIAATEALGRVAQGDDIALLRVLTLSRCEDQVAWEDELGDWEDWLDVQIAAIGALGDLAQTDSIDDMLAARDDELAQTLDIPVFEALGRMGTAGITWLLAIIETDRPLARKRAVKVLSKLAPEALRDHADTLEHHTDPALRIQAIALLDPSDAKLSTYLTEDADPTVRLAAFNRGVEAQDGFAELALRDRDAHIQAAALDALTLPLEPKFALAVTDHLHAWVRSSDTVLMCAAAKNLPRLAPAGAAEALIVLANDEGKPLPARIEATKALAACSPLVTLDVLVDLLGNPAQQIRLATLLMLKDRADEDGAMDIVRAAIDGSLLPEKMAVRSNESDTHANDAAMAKDEDDGPARLRITEDGEIIEASDPPPETASTLSAIIEPLRTDNPVELAEDTPEESAPKRAKRRAIEGPNEVAVSLSQDAIRTCGHLGGDDITTCLTTIANEEDDALCAAAWAALESRAPEPDTALRTAAKLAISHDDPRIRLSAFRVLDFGATEPDLAALARKDGDAIIRAEAVRHADPVVASTFVSDPSNIVRRSALDTIAAADDPALLITAFDTLVDARFAATLADVIAVSDHVIDVALIHLVKPDISPQSAYVILQALGDDRPEGA